MMRPGRKGLFNAVTITVAAAIVVAAVLIMVRGAGLSDELDFGAGAYYYADAPQLQDLASEDHYQSAVPLWVHVILFLVWGWLMYLLWCWVDRRSK